MLLNFIIKKKLQERNDKTICSKFFFLLFSQKKSQEGIKTQGSHTVHTAVQIPKARTLLCFFFANIHLQEHVYKRMLLSFLYELPLNILSYKDREFEERDKAGMQRGSW